MLKWTNDLFTVRYSHFDGLSVHLQRRVIMQFRLFPKFLIEYVLRILTLAIPINRLLLHLLLFDGFTPLILSRRVDNLMVDSVLGNPLLVKFVIFYAEI